MTQDKFGNRLWAYVAQQVRQQEDGSGGKQRELGGEVDRLISLSCAGVHGTPTAARVRALITDLALLTVGVLSLSPRNARNPYRPYAQKLIELVRRAAPSRGL